jgi:predicted RNA-binding protein Jag
MFFSGKNLQQAVLAAARHFDLEPDQLAYRDRTRTTGIVKSAKAVIEVDPANARRVQERVALVSPPALQSEAPALLASSSPELARTSGSPPERRAVVEPAGASSDAPRNPVEPEVVVAAATEAMRRLLRLSGVAASSQISFSRGRVRVDLAPSGPGVGEPGDGALARSMETLLARMLRAGVGEAFPCHVDWIGGDRQQRELELAAIANDAAARALAEGIEVELPAMDARDRRVVHVALQDHEGVASESRGEGTGRRLVVSPRRFT